MTMTRLVVWFGFLAACGTATDLGDQPVARGERENILQRATRLQGSAVASRREGAWEWRVAGSGAAVTIGAAGLDGSLRLDSADRGLLALSVASAPASAAVPGADPALTAGYWAAAPAREKAGDDKNAVAASPMRAGATDDNADFAAFVEFLDQSRARPELINQWRDLDVGGRSFVQVVGPDGAPQPGVVVQIVDPRSDKVAARGTTYGDGRMPFYPKVAAADGASGGSYLVEVLHGGKVTRHQWLGDRDTVVHLPAAANVAQPVTADVVFLIDTTGSMQDEIDRIKATLLSVTEKLRGLGREFDLRCGAVLYRDVGDAYVTAQHPFTNDIAALDTALRAVNADGGGDGPESLNQGLAVAVDGMGWRDGAAKLVFLVADAPPHLDYTDDVQYDVTLRAAVSRGIKVHAVAASGIDDGGSIVFRQIAQFTRGQFVFIEYGGDVTASGAAHGVAGVTKSNNLDDILFERIRDEIAGWGREVSPRLAGK
ncbi:MAG: VWA domain-containing protein [Planctomycetes bacterium]|nr:VWA domain-containing protein [Planctomycetota bacterium]